MNILIVGLGLIGGSYALGLSKAGHTVYGVDQDIKAITYAKKNKMVMDAALDSAKFIDKADVIVLALYPQDIISFLEDNKSLFRRGQYITDVCGVKTSYLEEAYRLSLPAEYIAHHPMAGMEKRGIYNANDEMFKKANFLICPLIKNTSDAVKAVETIGRDLQFGKISIMNNEKHDQMIAFTSQLTHAIAVSLVNSDYDEDTKNYIGDSYRDLTRIAMINEKLWSELFLENKQNLLKKIENFEFQLDRIKMALAQNDKETLEELFIQSTIKRNEMEK